MSAFEDHRVNEHDANEQQLLRYAADLQELVAQHTQLAQRYKRVLEKLRTGRRSRDQLVNMALHDQLTGLPNRYLLDQCMETALLAAEADEDNGDGIYLLYLDLDRFKPINDQHGHDTGDQVLVTVAKRIQSQVRSCDTVARVGGDEFVILLQGLKSSEVARRIIRSITIAVEQPMDIGGVTLSVGISIGMSQHKVDGEDLPTLLRAADRYMYQAKGERTRLRQDQSLA